jgi:hypothetical protein
MLLFILYYAIIAVCILATLIVTGNPLALFGLLLLFFANQVVPSFQQTSSVDAQGTPIGFHADLSED